MDLDGVRTFVAIVDAGQFQAAADGLSITQQAVSKRVAALERDLGVQLLTRNARGVTLSVDGQALLPHARELLRAEDRALASVTPQRRPLRVDVINRRIAPAVRVHAFYRQHPDIALDVVALPDIDTDTAFAAVTNGTVDATFRTVLNTSRLSRTLRSAHVIDDAHQLLVGPRHPLADNDVIVLAELERHPVWMPGLPSTTDWGAYYAELASTFGLRIDVLGPNFGGEVLLAEIADSPDLATFVGEGSRYLWPAHYDLRRIPIVDPTPVYPMSIVWARDNRNESLAALVAHLMAVHADHPVDNAWVPPRWTKAL
ncbi:LysR family transcriptional regulator [Gordonia sp. SID5947]|uniref:LysR family transcriptional regulator n=1 Tax=Gordonia sp. SID5947 TaxID=2690315 RepID=UPI00136E256A|nr:LysR family transcriptional regulator [Gordonia sp. SID5947]MYR05544.1 LysR family transcriptional regulator [Gordonia sp. SID5947]